jgi:hypothetical protein
MIDIICLLEGKGICLEEMVKIYEHVYDDDHLFVKMCNWLRREIRFVY